MKKRASKIATLGRRLRVLFPQEGNYKIVALCVAGATIFWFFSALNKPNYTTRIRYPIAFSYNTDSTYLLSSLPEDITLEISGGGWDLLRKTLVFNEPPLEIPLDDPTQTKFIPSQSLASRIRRNLAGVALNAIVTDTLFIDIDSMRSKEVPVVLDSVHLSLDQQRKVISPITITPSRVTLQGAASVIAEAPDTLLVALPDEEVDEEEYQTTISLEYAHPAVTVEPPEAEIHFRTAPFATLKQPVRLVAINFPKDSSAYPATKSASVTFAVPQSVADTLKADPYQFRVVIDFEKVNADSTVTPVVRNHPALARDIVLTPSTIPVRYER